MRKNKLELWNHKYSRFKYQKILLSTNKEDLHKQTSRDSSKKS